MSVNLAPVGNDAPFIDASGNPLSGGLLYFYTAGSDTPQNTYTTSAGSVANANPVVLNSGGYPVSGGNVVEIWFTAGVSYKAVLKTSAGVTVWTRDNLSGINDTTVTIDQWVSGPAPTYVSATQFTLVGDQTSTFMVGRRLKTTNSGGTIYSRISVSAYGALTTITVVNDSGTLDAGLSAVSYGLLSATNVSIPRYAGDFTTIASSGAVTLGTPGSANTISGATTFNQAVQVGKLSTANTSVSMDTATPTTLLALPASVNGVLKIYAYDTDSTASSSAAIAEIICRDDNSYKIGSQSDGTKLTLTLSGGNIVATQTSGITKTVFVVYTWLAVF